jgi:hypothetical protein
MIGWLDGQIAYWQRVKRMSEFEVAEPILNSPFEEPRHYWYIREGETPQKRESRRPAFVFPPRDQSVGWTHDGYVLKPSTLYPTGYELALVNLIRDRRTPWEQAATRRAREATVLCAVGGGKDDHLSSRSAPRLLAGDSDSVGRAE